MAGSVENIPLGKAIGEEYRKNYNFDKKASPISTRRVKESNMAVTNGITAHTHKGTSNMKSSEHDVVRGGSLDLCRSDSDSDTSEVEKEIARLLARDFVFYKTDNITSRPQSIYTETLRRVGDEIEEKYEITLNGIVNQLRYDQDNDGRRAFYASLDSMFEEGPCSWGRVVMVYVFASRLAKYCKENGRDNVCVEDLARYAGDYVSGYLTEWIRKQPGGWDDFCSKFKAKDWKDKAVFNSLLVTGLFLGGMATLRLFTK